MSQSRNPKSGMAFCAVLLAFVAGLGWRGIGSYAWEAKNLRVVFDPMDIAASVTLTTFVTLLAIGLAIIIEISSE